MMSRVVFVHAFQTLLPHRIDYTLNNECLVSSNRQRAAHIGFSDKANSVTRINVLHADDTGCTVSATSYTTQDGCMV